MRKALLFLPLFSLVCTWTYGQVVDVSLDASTGTETAGTVITVTATASIAVTNDQTVEVAVSGPGITATDYLLSNTTITITDGSTTGSVTFTIQDDAVDEIDETATITISNPSIGITLGATTTADVTITDDDPEPDVTLSASLNNIAENGGVTTLTATLSAISEKTVTVNLNYVDNETTGADYSGASSIIINPGNPNATTDVTGQNDSDVEGNETFTVEISGVTNGVESGVQQEVITITDDDDPTISFDGTSGMYPGSVNVNSDITITFSDPIRNLDDSELVDGDLAALITFRFDAVGGVDAGFTATINAGKTVVTLVPNTSPVAANKLWGRRTYYVSFDGTQVETQTGEVTYSSQDDTFTTSSIGDPGSTPTLSFGTVDDNSIQLNWTGANDAERYLLYGSTSFASLEDNEPNDTNAPPAEDTNLGDGFAVVILDNQAGANTYTFNGLSPSITYNFKIVAFNNFNSDWQYRQNNTRVNTTTTCTAPAGQASNITFGTTNAGSMQVNWNRGTPSGDGVIVVARRNSPVSFVPTNGNDYAGNVNSDFGNATSFGGNRIVFRGSGTGVMVTNLEASNTYHYAVYEYNSAGDCYNTVSPATGSNATTGVDNNTTITEGDSPSNTLPSTNTTSNGLPVFSFRVTDIGGTGSDGRDTDIEAITFREVGGEFTDLTELIAGAQLTGAGGTRNASAGGIQADRIVITGIPINNGNLGDINNGTSKVYTLRVWFRDPLDNSNNLRSTVDGKRLVFEVSSADISAQAADSQIAPGQTVSSEDMATPKNVIDVSATELRFIQQPSDVFILSNMSPAVTVEATDANGNRDLDYTGTVDLTSTGTLQSTPSATFVTGVGTYGTIVHTADQNNRTLSTTNSAPALTDAGPSGTFDVTGPATNSDIIADAGFTYPTDIPYINHQEATDITISASSIEVAGFTIRDGGSGTDGDVFGTTLTSIEFTLANAAYIRRLALYADLDDNGSYETEISEATPVGNTVTFSPITLSTVVDGNRNFALRASFTTNVADNQQFSFQITDVTSDPLTSGFAAGNAGGAVSSTAGDDNRIEVIATRQEITTQPDPFVRQGIAIPTQPVVIAEDANDLLDLDYSGTVTVSNAGTLSMAGVPTAYSGGTLTFAGFTYNDEGNGTLTIASPTLSDVVSTAVFVDGTAPTAEVNDDQADAIVRDGDVVNFTFEFTENDTIVFAPPPTITIGSVISNQSLSPTLDDNLIWTFQWTVPSGNDGPAAITINATDRAGNPMGALTAGDGATSYTIDNTAPTVSSITRFNPTSPTTNATSVQFEVQFIEAVTGVDIADFTPDFGNVTAVTGSGDTYVVTVSGLDGLTETVGIDVLAATAVLFDIAGNSYNANFTGGETYQIDNTPPLIQTLSPADNSFNNPVGSNLVIRFNENISLATSSLLIGLFRADNTQIESFDISTSPLIAFNGTDQLTINPTLDLDEGTGYYVQIAPGTVTDIAGNDFAGITNQTEWNFTTFATPQVTAISPIGCVGGDITITGQFLTGVTTVRFNGTGGNVNAASFTIDNDNQITATVPFYTAPITSLSGTLFLEKVGGGNPTRDITTVQTVQIGPSQAQLGPGTIDNDPVCSSGTTTTSTIQVTIRGGLPPYTVDYDLGVETGYTSGNDIIINPPSAGVNTYTLNSVTDANGCPVPVPQLTGAYQVTENIRRTVEAGGNASGELDYCPASDGLAVNLNAATLGTGPSVTGVGSIEWSTLGDGSFNNANALNAIYTIGVGDLVGNSVVLSLRTTANPTACDEVVDVLTINFVSSATADPGGQGGILEYCWDGTDPAVVPLSGAISGAATPLWATEGASDGAFSNVNIANPTYTFGITDMTNGFATVSLTPDGGSCGAGSSAPLQINLVPIPTNSFLAPVENSVCIDQSSVVYSIADNTGSTYNWTVADNNTSSFVGQGTSTIIVDWGSTPGNYNVEVVETDINGCQSNPIILPVTVNDLPVPEILRPLQRTFDVNSDPFILRGGISPDTLQGQFLGPGVFFTDISGDINWFFDPNQAGLTTPGNEHDVSFEYTDTNGCTGVVTESFEVRDGSGSIINTGNLMVLEGGYCQDNPPITIALNPASNISLTPGGLFEFFGRGIVSSDPVTQTAVFDPSLAAQQLGALPRQINISYRETVSEVRNIPTPPFSETVTVVNELGQQSVTINNKPNPLTNLNELPASFCEDEGPFDLVFINDISNGQIGEFTAQNPHAGTIQQISDQLFRFRPGNVTFPFTNNDPNNDFSPQVVNIDFRYTADTGCDTLVTRSVEILQKPPPPIVNETNVCIVGDDIPRVRAIGVNATNNVPINGDVVIRWFDSNDVLVTTGNILDEAILQEVTGAETFKVAQRVNGCLSQTVDVIIEKVDALDFSVSGSCIGDGIVFTQNTGNTALDNLTWSINDILVDTQNNPIDPSFTFNFSQPGLYDVKLNIQTLNGCTDSLTQFAVVTSQGLATNEINYFQNFEDNTGSGWVGTGLNNTWEYGTPTPGTGITLGSNSGSVIWITGLDRPYSKSEESFLYSPCFDLSNLDRPLLSFDHWSNTADGEDGVVVEYSTTGINGTWQRLGNFDNGIQSGINWYNQRDISSNPGNQTVGFYGWSGDSQGWLESKHSLDEIPPAGRQEVLFRFSLSSTEGSDAVDKPDGFAIDNVFIGNRTRVILIENFTNTEQANNTLNEANVLDNFIGTTEERVILNYHTAFPGQDPANTDNTAVPSARALYYGISEVPRARMDGAFRTDLGDLFSQWGESEYGIRTLSNAPINLVVDPQVNGNMLDINVQLNTFQDIAPNSVAHVVIVENTISIANDYNLGSVGSGQTTLNAVVREMLPSATGTKFPDQIPAGETRVFTTSWQPSNEIFDPSNVNIVVFVQDEVTREVYQAALINNVTLPPLVTSIDGDLTSSPIQTYPNPADDEFIVRFNQPLTQVVPIVIFDTFGKLVFEKEISVGSNFLRVDTRSFVPGMYHIQLELSEGEIVKRRLVIMHD